MIRLLPKRASGGGRPGGAAGATADHGESGQQSRREENFRGGRVSDGCVQFHKEYLKLCELSGSPLVCCGKGINGPGETPYFGLTQLAGFQACPRVSSLKF